MDFLKVPLDGTANWKDVSISGNTKWVSIIKASGAIDLLVPGSGEAADLFPTATLPCTQHQGLIKLRSSLAETITILFGDETEEMPRLGGNNVLTINVPQPLDVQGHYASYSGVFVPSANFKPLPMGLALNNGAGAFETQPLETLGQGFALVGGSTFEFNWSVAYNGGAGGTVNSVFPGHGPTWRNIQVCRLSVADSPVGPSWVDTVATYQVNVVDQQTGVHVPALVIDINATILAGGVPVFVAGGTIKKNGYYYVLTTGFWLVEAIFTPNVANSNIDGCLAWIDGPTPFKMF